MSDPTNFDEFVEEQERDPEMKRLLDAARARYRDDEPPTTGVREPRPIHPQLGGAVADD